MDATTLKMNYVIKFVAEMDRAVKFYRDALGLPPKFQSPGWSEFATGETMLALHPADEGHIAGTVQLGFYSRRRQQVLQRDERKQRGRCVVSSAS